MPDCADTARLSPDERLRKAAAILATGVLRLRQRAALPPEKGTEKPSRIARRRPGRLMSRTPPRIRSPGAFASSHARPPQGHRNAWIQ